MKNLKVTVIDPLYFDDERTSYHHVGTAIPEEAYIVAILQGVINAGVLIKEFELVDAD